MIFDNATMGGQVVIKQLEFRGRCGVTPEERARPQPLAVDLELDCQLETAGLSDNLAHTIDYANVVQRVVELGTGQDSQLLESMAERFFRSLFDEFPVGRIKLWLRKLHPPISHVTSSVGITLKRTRLEQQLLRTDPPPTEFLVQQLHRVPKGKVLDVACGNGRHTLFLASLGYQVEAIDRDEPALAHLSATARMRNLAGITARPIDLERPASDKPDLKPEAYDAIVVFFYLARPLFPHLIQALKPGGIFLYETFTIDNHTHFHHPKRKEFCLAHNELLHLASNLRILQYDEGLHEGSRPPESVYTARLVAQKPMASGFPT
jgi:dihydroneopterin aldolase